MFEVKVVPFQEVKVDLDQRIIEGLCAAYGNVDDGGDRLHFGSGKHIAEANPTLPVFYGHGWMQNERPLAKSLYFEERKEGLFTKSKVFDTPAGEEVLVGAHEGVITCMSIGWKALEAKKTREDGKSIRDVFKYNLYEYSYLPTGFAMNSGAVITSVKSWAAILEKARWVDGVTAPIDVGGDPSWESIKDAVLTALHDYYRGKDVSIYYRDLSDSAVIYDLRDWRTGDEKTFQMGYSVSEGGAVTLDGEPIGLDIRVTYVPIGDGAKAAAGPETKGVLSYATAHKGGTPTADKDTSWDGPGQVAKASVEDLKVMCAWVDSDKPGNKTAYKFPHHLADGEHAVVFKALVAAMGRLNQANIPAGDRRGIYNHLAKHYEQFEEEPPAFGKSIDLTDASIPAKDYRELRSLVEKSDPVGLLIDEAAYLNSMAKTLKAEGREDEVRQALSELDSATVLLKGLCPCPTDSDDSDLIAMIRQMTANINEASRTLVS